MTDQPKQDAIVSQRARDAAAAFMGGPLNGKYGGEYGDLRTALVVAFAEIEAATIERCAQVAEETTDEGWAAYEIRNLKGQTS